MRDLKIEIGDLKIQRANLWKKVELLEAKYEYERKRVNRWKDKFYNLKKKIYALSTIKASELDKDTDSD